MGVNLTHVLSERGGSGGAGGSAPLIFVSYKTPFKTAPLARFGVGLWGCIVGDEGLPLWALRYSSWVV